MFVVFAGLTWKGMLPSTPVPDMRQIPFWLDTQFLSSRKAFIHSFKQTKNNIPCSKQNKIKKTDQGELFLFSAYFLNRAYFRNRKTQEIRDENCCKPKYCEWNFKQLVADLSDKLWWPNLCPLFWTSYSFQKLFVRTPSKEHYGHEVSFNEENYL